MMSVYFQILVILLIYATVWFGISVYKKRNDVADIAWGLGYCMICIYLFFSQPHHLAAIVLYALVMVWGLRLSMHIYFRNRGKSEDFRYRQWREEWGKTFYWRSYLQVYLLQALILFVIISPVVWVSISVPVSWSWLMSIGACIWLVGFVYQSVADYQLSTFVRNRKDRNAIMRTGLWKYSRHPNYFGEILMWWGIFGIALSFEYGIAFIVSPLTITLLLAKVSGVPMLEKKYEDNAAFQEYKTKAPALVPKWW
jgi:steroid 5-alpha reductase family enzyme